MISPPDLTVADTFRRRRTTAGVTAARLAAAADVSLSFLSAVEHGYRPASSPAIARIDAALTAIERGEVVA